ncbi:hypothetical protein CLV88_11985 [Shimia abyssi]|uniref:Uncharacterized protein n=1 Tax=Shimia abyssi TaxID=1662395 RepID=A0A2P8F6I8_9RHOB|nr:hypothetical protein CLV88_11985 [Shimia abyssi]
MRGCMDWLLNLCQIDCEIRQIALMVRPVAAESLFFRDTVHWIKRQMGNFGTIVSLLRKGLSIPGFVTKSQENGEAPKDRFFLIPYPSRFGGL